MSGLARGGAYRQIAAYKRSSKGMLVISSR